MCRGGGGFISELEAFQNLTSKFNSTLDLSPQGVGYCKPPYGQSSNNNQA